MKALCASHCIVFEPDLACRRILESALANLYWTVAVVESLSDVKAGLPGPWATLLAIESGDPAAKSARSERRHLRPARRHRPRPTGGMPGSSVSPNRCMKEIVEALVAGFMARRP
jgi:hypothetical protein